MRRVLTVLGVLAAVGLLVIFVLRRPRTGGGAEQTLTPELIRLGPNTATIAWQSAEQGAGRVFFRPAGSAEEARSAEDALAASVRHEVELTGLQAGTRYSYWLAGTDRKYQFQTKPVAATPFSFLVVHGEPGPQIPGLALSEFAEFVLSLSGRPLKATPVLREMRSYLPVYSLRGEESPWRDGVHEDHTPKDAWLLEWGGLRLVILAKNDSGLAAALAAPAAHTIGVVLGSGAAASLGGPDPAAIRDDPLHNALTAYNARHPTRPAAFVLLPGSAERVATVDGVCYVALGPDNAAGRTARPLRVDVGEESVRGSFLPENDQHVLRAAPLAERRTCEECRRLADQGAYERSLAAYREFVRANTGHYQIDDAYYAIAELLDQRLFRLAESVAGYKEFLAKYPDSALAPIARRRVAELQAHADHDYEPLTRFERLRAQAASLGAATNGRAALTKRARGIVEEFSDSTVAPRALAWLANQHRQRDPDRAAAVYEELLRRYPACAPAQTAWLDIGDTYYAARRYRDALNAYDRALRRAPEEAAEIRRMAWRARRNLRRRRIGWLGWTVLVLIAGMALCLRPAGLAWRVLLRGVVVFCVVCAVSLLHGWLIAEQFLSMREMVSLCLAFAVGAGLGVSLSGTLAHKLFGLTSGAGSGARRIWCVLLGAGFGILCLVATVWLVILRVNEHYFAAFGL